MNNTSKLAAIAAVQATIPAFVCLPGCSDCCGPVVGCMSRMEWKRILERTGKKEDAACREQLDRALHGDGKCIFLGADNKCSIYDIRPTICRVFGSSSATTGRACLVCPHGAGPEKPMGAAQTEAVIGAVERLGV